MEQRMATISFIDILYHYYLLFCRVIPLTDKSISRTKTSSFTVYLYAYKML